MFSPCSPFWSLSSLARPRSLGRLPKRFFVTRTAQNTIRKNNDKKNDRLGSQSDGGHVYYRRQHADCQARFTAYRRALPAGRKPLPLGEVSSEVTERAGPSQPSRRRAGLHGAGYHIFATNLSQTPGFCTPNSGTNARQTNTLPFF